MGKRKANGIIFSCLTTVSFINTVLTKIIKFFNHRIKYAKDFRKTLYCNYLKYLQLHYSKGYLDSC